MGVTFNDQVSFWVSRSLRLSPKLIYIPGKYAWVLVLSLMLIVIVSFWRHKVIAGVG